MSNIKALDRLVAQFTKLPGVGAKTAQRFAYRVINMTEAEAEEFASAIVDAKQNVGYCTVCGGYSDKEVCDICQKRDDSVICVVKDPKDVAALEKTKDFDGVYHVLHGTLNPLLGQGPDDIRVKELLARLDGVKEVIMATNPDVDGEATAVYLARLIKPMGIKVTRIASGISIGSDIEYADEVTLSRALADRKPL